jgi:hypothetical protein
MVHPLLGERAGVRGISLYINHYRFLGSPLFLTDLHTAHEPTGCSLRGNRQPIASEITSDGGWFTLSSGERAGVRGVSLCIKHYRFMGSPAKPVEEPAFHLLTYLSL